MGCITDVIYFGGEITEEQKSSLSNIKAYSWDEFLTKACRKSISEIEKYDDGDDGDGEPMKPLILLLLLFLFLLSLAPAGLRKRSQVTRNKRGSRGSRHLHLGKHRKSQGRAAHS